MKKKSAQTVCLNFVTALSCEAKPLIDYYGLVKQSYTAFPHFFKPSCEQHSYNINLVVSGIGMQSMATACGWLSGVSSNEPAVWLNIGTAGHATLQLGEIVRVVCATQANANTSHFPPLVAKWAGVNAPLISSTAPVSRYPEQSLVDMEASAFFVAAKRFASAELVQALKVVSDNKENSIEQLNAAKLSAFIAERMNAIHEFSETLLELAAAEKFIPQIPQFSHQLHSTHSQTQQFKDLTNKLVNLCIDKQEINNIIYKAVNMKALLAQLKVKHATLIPDLKIVNSD